MMEANQENRRQPKGYHSRNDDLVKRDVGLSTKDGCQEQMEALMDISLETTETCVEKIEANQGK
jgi:hypothetical protein